MVVPSEGSHLGVAQSPSHTHPHQEVSEVPTPHFTACFQLLGCSDGASGGWEPFPWFLNLFGFPRLVWGAQSCKHHPPTWFVHA